MIFHPHQSRSPDFDLRGLDGPATGRIVIERKAAADQQIIFGDPLTISPEEADAAQHSKAARPPCLNYYEGKCRFGDMYAVTK